jgi:hypothetical protein
MAEEKDTLKTIQTLVRVKADATLLSVEGQSGSYDLIFRLSDTRARWHAMVRDLLLSLAQDPFPVGVDISQQYRIKEGQLVVAGRIQLKVPAESRAEAFDQLRARIAGLPTPGRPRIMKARLDDVSWMRPMSNGSGVYQTSRFNAPALLEALHAMQGNT